MESCKLEPHIKIKRRDKEAQGPRRKDKTKRDKKLTHKKWKEDKNTKKKEQIVNQDKWGRELRKQWKHKNKNKS